MNYEQICQKFLEAVQKSVQLIYHPKDSLYPQPVGTGFIIRSEKNDKVFYCMLTNHNLNDILYYGEKAFLYANNSALNIDDLANKLNDLFICFPTPKDTHKDKSIPTFILPTFLIRSLIIPQERWGKNGATLDEMDFCILEIDFNIDKTKIKSNLSNHIGQERIDVYQKIADALGIKCCISNEANIDNLFEKIIGIKEYIIPLCYDYNDKIWDEYRKSCQVHSQNAYITGFPLHKADLTYPDSDESIPIFYNEYYTVRAEINKIEGNLISIKNFYELNNELITRISDRINGLSGSPILLTVEYTDKERSHICIFIFIVGMLITGQDAISIKYLKTILDDESKVYKIPNPDFNKIEDLVLLEYSQ